MLVSTIHIIKKRNGNLVDFNPDKILLAMRKAFVEVRQTADDALLEQLSTETVRKLELLFPEQTPTVEDVQDLVEKSLMESGNYDVAKAYILYRYEHGKIREEQRQDTLRKIESNDLMVIKRSGKQEKLSQKKLKTSLGFAIQGFENIVDLDALVEQCQQELHEGVTTRDIARAMIMTTRSLIEQDPVYSVIASRLLLTTVYKEVIGPDRTDFKQLDSQYREAFIRNIHTAVSIGRLDPRLLQFDLEFLASQLVMERDDLLRYLGTQTLADRYFLQYPETRQILETPQAFWMRVAMGLSLNEEPATRNDYAVRFYSMISTLRFVPSTPTLFHSGTLHPQLSSCYLTTVMDSLDHIFKSVSDNAQLSKWSGGIGNDWTNVRGTGSHIKGTGVESQGVIPFLKIANDTTLAINRSGRRRGATCAYLETWHYDIEDFLELRKNTGDERRRTHDMDTANWIPDLFMKRVRDNGEWTLFSPEEVPDLHHIYGKKFEDRYQEYERLAETGKIKLTRKLKARDLWKKMLAMLFETGHPWITFKDPSNIRSPQDHVGVVHCSNLCTEITLNTSAEETAVCNLGSINLAKHVIDGTLAEDMVRETATVAMRMLDNVIDVNFYPTIEAKNSNFKHRPVGLGIMGYQDALYLLDIDFDSDANLDFADTSMELISHAAIMASAQLAKERGEYQSFHGSKWNRDLFPVDTIALLEQERGETIDVPRGGKLDWTPVRQAVKQFGMRNSNCLAMAPTATISNIAGCVPTIEPIYKNIYVKSNVSGDFTVVNPYLIEELKALQLWDYEMLGKLKYNDGSIKAISEIPERLKKKYKEVFEIDPIWLIRSAARRGKWVDQSQSLNLYFVGSSGQKLSEAYLTAWQLGLKTTYYLRSLAASQVEKSTVNTTEYGVTHKRTAQEAVPAPTSAPQSAPASELMPTPSVSQPPKPAAAMPAQGHSSAQLSVIPDPNCEACQ